MHRIQENNTKKKKPLQLHIVHGHTFTRTIEQILTLGHLAIIPLVMRYGAKIYRNMTKTGLFWESQVVNPAQGGRAGLRGHTQSPERGSNSVM